MTVRQRLLSSFPPTDALVKRVVSGLFMTAVESEVSHAGSNAGRVGVTFTLREDEPIPHLCQEITNAGTLAGRPLTEVVQLLASSGKPDRSIGLAAFNSILHVSRETLLDVNILKWLAQEFRGKRVGMVGQFPFADKVKGWAGDFNIVELHEGAGRLCGKAGNDYLETCDLVILTGVTLLNDTFPDIMSHCSKAFSVMVGPSVPLHQLLHEDGVDLLGGIVAEDNDLLFQCIMEGAIVPRFRGHKMLAMSREPLGIDD